MTGIWKSAKLGKYLVLFVAVMLLLSQTAAIGLLTIATVLADESLVLLGFSKVLSFSITVLLCWGLYEGKPWGRWFSVARFGFTLLMLSPVSNTLKLFDGDYSGILDLMGAAIMFAGLILLLVGPGVGAFFALEGERRAEQEQQVFKAEKAMDRERPSYGTLSSTEKVIRCVQDLNRGLMKGGLEEYYRSPLADTANELDWALAEIGAGTVANLMSEANQLFDEGRPREDTPERAGDLGCFSWHAKAALARLDLRLEQELDDLTPLLAAYLGRHRSSS